MAENRAPQSNGDQAEKIDPSRAGAGAARWRRALADALGADPGAALDKPDRRLLMLRVFGATRRLADLCMAHPAAAAEALESGASPVLAEAARDLAALDRGVGGPDALHAALAPLKNRADIAIGLAELSGAWRGEEATAARADFAERLVDTALCWLVRAAVKRGELSVESERALTAGVFALAGGDFAHEDLAPYGPLDLIILFDEDAFKGPTPKSAERVFIRIGAELRETFEGKPGDYPLFSLRTPMGTKVGGSGLAESMARVRSAASGPQAQALRAWLATARIVAGDRSVGGAFLEEMEAQIWNGESMLDKEMCDKMEAPCDDPQAAFRAIAEVCRLTIGRVRPIFRTTSASEVFEIASESEVIGVDAARRLKSGWETAQMLVSRAQMMKGAAAKTATGEEEEQALASLCGYSDFNALKAVLDGARAEAANALHRLLRGPQEELARYKARDDDSGDADKLEDLGFLHGATLSNAIDEWVRLAGAQDSEKRFSALAPGLLTGFGETQHPNEAVRLFDRLVRVVPKEIDVFSHLAESAPNRGSIIDALGCFGAAVEPLLESPATAAELFAQRGVETPQDGKEWLARYAPPLRKAATLDGLAAWRRQSIGRIALFSASGDMAFDAAAKALHAVHLRALSEAFDIVSATCPKNEAKAAKSLALHVYDGFGNYTPGAAFQIGFVAGEESDAVDSFARRYLEALDGLGEGYFALSPDVSRRPGGVAGALAPGLDAFKQFVLSEAIALDQILLTRARVVAGEAEAQDNARDAIRSAVSGARRADVLLRDLDRARAQRMRRDRASSEWDIDKLEGGRQDAELIISTLFYRHAGAHPVLQDDEPEQALKAMARSGLIPPETATALISAREFWSRIAVARGFGRWSDPTGAPVRARFGALIARAAGVERFDQARPLIRGYADDLNRLYAQLVLGRPTLNLVANG
ncbi:MAG: hypothetical protein ACE5FO_07260 [Parvularculaceae bacterium]